MQVRAARSLARRQCWNAHHSLRPPPFAPAIGQSQRWNSFIKQVMEQVKKDMEKDPKMKKDWEKVQRSATHMHEKGTVHQKSFDEFAQKASSASVAASEVLDNFRHRTMSAKNKIYQRASETTESNEAFKNASDFIKARYDVGMSLSSSAFQKSGYVFSSVMNKTSSTLSWVSGENEKAQKYKEWKIAQASRDAAAQAAKAQAEAEASTVDVDSSTEARDGRKMQGPEVGDALVVSKASSSSWDRFGANMRDMPFLSNVFDNPLFDRLFGESELAASIQEMKEIDRSFYLEDFAEEIEYAVAPHIVQTYLDGNQEALQLHCGEAAFAAVNASIKARKQQKMTLDANILAGPKEVELKGAQRMDKGPPCFIWTFNTQQVNCLRDKSGEIIEGAVDDIRTVYYAMAVTRHPELEKTLEYPWQVSELAIVGNQPCF